MIDRLKKEKDDVTVSEAIIDELRAVGYKGEPPVTRADYVTLMDRWKTMVRAWSANPQRQTCSGG